MRTLPHLVTASIAIILPIGAARAQPCASYFPPIVTGVVQDARVNEASGMVASTANPGAYWVHNDSGDSARFFAVAEDGTVLAVFNLTGAAATDWEDMARGPGPVAGVSYLYFADIGDNAAARAFVTVYRVPEPSLPATSGAEIDLAGAVALEMEYPDAAHDAETLLTDPLTGDLFVVTKCIFLSGCSDGISHVYRYPFPHQEGVRVTLAEVAAVPFSGPVLAQAATAGDISPNGDRIVLRTYASAFEWTRGAGESIADALAAPGCAVPLATEPQGETIAYSSDGASYTTLSEQAGQPLQRSDRRFADRTLVSRALAVRDPSAGSDPAARRLTAAAAKAGAAPIAGDPTARGAVLDVALEGTNPTTQRFVLLPAIDAGGGALWRQLAAGGGFRYADRDGERGPITRLLLRQSGSGRLVLRVSANGTNGSLALIPPAPGVAGSVTLRFPGGDRYCARYGPEGRSRNDGAELFRSSGPTAEACPP